MDEEQKKRRQLQKQEAEILMRMREIFPLAEHPKPDDFNVLEQKAHHDKNNELLSLLKELKQVQMKLRAV